MKKRSSIDSTINNFINLESLFEDTKAALELAESGEEDFLIEAEENLLSFEKILQEQEIICKMKGAHDNSAVILEINGGSGGTEAQDWAEMLQRMYMRWAERRGFTSEILDYHAGEEAGVKSVTLLVKGEYAYGFLRSEQGVHRLVRISPFDSNARRHTSFAGVSATPEIEEDIEIDINESDLRVDTYRASGAGGQHVNKTDSAVRLTHLPTGVVVACQSGRSQHKNKATAMKMLKSKLYELMIEEQAEKIENLKGERKKIDFGSQIRSYVLHPYQMVKDLRTNHETSNTEAILDGEIDGFIESYLNSDLNK